VYHHLSGNIFVGDCNFQHTIAVKNAAWRGFSVYRSYWSKLSCSFRVRLS